MRNPRKKVDPEESPQSPPPGRRAATSGRDLVAKVAEPAPDGDVRSALEGPIPISLDWGQSQDLPQATPMPARGVDR